MSTVATMTRVPEADLAAFVARIFSAVGMPERPSGLLSKSLVASDLRGVPSHGVIHVPGYVRRMTVGGVDPRGTPRVVRRRGGALRIDGGNTMGQIAADFAMDEAIAAAKEHGVSFASVGNSNHCGALAYFAEKALAHDMIGMIYTNALPTMAPWGGRDRILGINPFSIALPVEAMPPFVLDISFSAVSRGKIVVHDLAGMPLGEGWALDETGRPTTDPAAALRGLLLPIGGHKGTGLAIASGVLSTLLSGATFGPGMGSLEEGAIAGSDGHAVMAIDIAAFEDPTHFKAGLAKILGDLKGSSLAEGSDRISYPGEGSSERVLAQRRDGISIAIETVGALNRTAEAVNLPDRLPLPDPTGTGTVPTP